LQEHEIIAEIASEWGWTEKDVNECVWYNVPKYLAEVRKAKARRLLNDVAVEKLQGKQLTDWAARLEAQAKDEAEETVSKDVAMLKRMIGVARAFGNADKAKELSAKAAYLEACMKYGVENG
jgi:hypothetical protein